MPLAAGTPPDNRLRIVIADDDPLFAALLRARLAGRPELEVVGLARDGAEAVALAEQLLPDLLLMDVHMPGVDGIEATRLVRDLPDPPTVVLITGDDEDADARAYEAGAAAYLQKSVDIVSLIDVVVAVSRVARTTV
jgi:two-component system nitrate/nitrite response regulator NarL